MYQSSVASVAKGQMEYVTLGKGETCLLLHGGHSNCFEVFGTEEILAAKRSALIPSRPGYGKTPASVGKSASEAADALVALLDHLSLEKVSVLAISAGGPTALHLAARYPKRVDKLVLESAVTKRWLEPRDALYKRARRMFHPRSQHLTWGMLRIFVRLTPTLIYKQMIPSFSTLATAEVLSSLTAEDRAAFRNMLLHLSSSHGFMLDIEHDVPPKLLKDITAPTLIVHSKNDNSVPLEHAFHAESHIENATLFEAKTWGHLIWLGEESAAVKARVADFLREGRD